MGECQATTIRGRVCGAHSRAGSLYCFMHDPARASERQAARKLGGMRRGSHAGDESSIPAKIRTVEDILAMLDYVRAELAALDNGVQRSRVFIALAGEYLHCFEVGDIEKRLERLEEVVNGKQKT